MSNKMRHGKILNGGARQDIVFQNFNKAMFRGEVMFFGVFTKKKDVCKAFQIDNIDGILLFACYEVDGREGKAEVLYIKNGKFYHVVASHCSSFGLENKFEPNELPLTVMHHVIDNGNGLLHRFRDPLRRVLEVVENTAIRDLESDTTKVAIKLAFG